MSCMQMLWRYNWPDCSFTTGDLSQDPAPPSACHSLEPPPHVKHPLVEEENSDGTTDAEEASSAEEGTCTCAHACMCICRN